MNPVVYFNGRLMLESEATLAISDGGWLHGAGLFETFRALNGRIFRLEAHIERLRRSAEKLLRPMDRNQLPAEQELVELLERNNLRAARMRLTVSAGPMRTVADEAKSELSICVTAVPFVEYAAKFYEEGIQVIICPYKQSADDPTAGHKTTCYLPRLLGLREAQKARCIEALWFNTRNELAEGSISNVFLVSGGVLKTPPLDTPVLPGVIREFVLHAAREAGIGAEEVRLTIDDLLAADECFLTNSIMGVMPVVRVERHDFKDGKVGPITRQLSNAYRDAVRKESEL